MRTIIISLALCLVWGQSEPLPCVQRSFTCPYQSKPADAPENCIDTSLEMATNFPEIYNDYVRNKGWIIPFSPVDSVDSSVANSTDSTEADVGLVYEDLADWQDIFVAPGFIAVYVWVGLVTVLPILWCCLNQRVLSKKTKTKARRESMNLMDTPLAEVMFEQGERQGSARLPANENSQTNLHLKQQQHGEEEVETLKLTRQGSLAKVMDVHQAPSDARTKTVFVQMGMKDTWVGMLLYYFVVLTGVVILCFLGYLSCNCYWYWDDCVIDPTDCPDGDLVACQVQIDACYQDMRRWLVPDGTLSLTFLIIIWNFGALFFFVVKYSPVLRYHFRTSCSLADATTVRIWMTKKTEVASVDPNLLKMHHCNQAFEQCLARIFAFIFSDVNNPTVEGRFFYANVMVDAQGVRSIFHHFKKYVYTETSSTFEEAEIRLGAGPKPTLADLHNCAKGLTEEEANRRISLVGPNVVDLPKPSVIAEFISEGTRPFYVYQIWMMWPWFAFSYWYMGAIQTSVFVGGGLAVIWVNFQNSKLLYKLAKSEGNARVLRDGQYVTKPLKDLAPGDVVQIEPGPTPCDLVLIRGQLVVDESALTGESMPVQKIATENNQSIYDESSHKKATLFAGTTILENDEARTVETLAVVVNSGANTSKAEQFRGIAYRDQPLFKFDVQVKIVLLILSIWGLVTFLLTVSFLAADPTSAWYYGMYVVATALPPLLPTVFVVSVSISSSRLAAERKVICSDPSRLLMAGKVRVACFDKTGTLTVPGLAFQGFRPCNDSKLQPMTKEVDGSSVSTFTPLVNGMAVCHSLSHNGKQYIGNAVDKDMFLNTGFKLNIAGRGDNQATYDTVTKGETVCEVLKRWDFDHHSQTMAVACKTDGQYTIFVKGSFEAVKKRCISNVPADYDLEAETLAKNGYYTLSVGCRPATPDEVTSLSSGQSSDEATSLKSLERHGIEENLTFLGFITFRNDLKPDTTEALARLYAGSVRICIITGDHPLTAIYISRASNVVREGRSILWSKSMDDEGEPIWMDPDEGDKIKPLPADLSKTELIVVGDVFRSLRDQKKIEKYLYDIRVYARMSPQDKIDVVELYIKAGDIVSMCGDGGNDCGALRAAHVGVALSDSEASVVSPFTGTSKSVMSVVDVFLEGRCALSSAFAGYRYMIQYGQVETIIQVVNAYLQITLSEWCWVFMDGCWVLAMSFTLVLAAPEKVLAPFRPVSGLLGLETMSSAIGMTCINFIFLVIGLGVLWKEDFYQCRPWNIDLHDISLVNDIGDNYEATVIFLVAGTQYISSGIALNFGGLHRAAYFKNWRFVALSTCFLVMQFVANWYPGKWSCIFKVNCDNENLPYSILTLYKGEKVKVIQNEWNTTLMPTTMRGKLMGLMIGNLIALICWEKLVVNGPVGWWLRKKYPAQKYIKL